MISIFDNMIVNASHVILPDRQKYNSFLDFYDLGGTLLQTLRFEDFISFFSIDAKGNIYAIDRGDADDEKIIRYTITSPSANNQ